MLNLNFNRFFLVFFLKLKLESVLTWKAGCLVDKNLELLDPALVDEGEPNPPLAPRCPLPQAARRKRIHRSSTKNIVLISAADSVADPYPGSGAFLTPGSGIRNRFFPDPGSRIPNPYF